MADYDYLNNTTADVRLLGMPNILSSLPQFVSAPRMSMYNHHLSQTMIIDQPEFNKLFTGNEHKMMEYRIDASSREHHCEVIDIIPKYTTKLITNDVNPQFYVITLSVDKINGHRILDYFTVDRYFMGNNGFGWLSEIENLGQLKRGNILDKDMPIVHSPAVKGNQYCLGTNLNTIYGSFPETIEDAFIISASAAKKLQTQQVSQRVLDFRMDRRPLNLYGSTYVEEDKFFPDIGSVVRDDGILFAARPVHWTTCVADTDPVALREPLPFQDDIVHAEPGARILDLTFNVNRNKVFLNNCYSQARLYETNNTDCWKGIYQRYLDYNKTCRLSNKMSTLVREAMYHLVAQGFRSQSLDNLFNKSVKNFEVEGVSGHLVDFIQAIVTYTVPRPVANGSKLSDVSGAKGVVGHVYPDEWMPVDDYGIRADLWIDMNSPVSRNNPSQLYECGINRIGEFVRRKVESVYKVQGTDAGFDTLTDWYDDINPNWAKLVRESATNTMDKKNIVTDAIRDGVRVWLPPFLDKLTPSDKEFFNALINVKSWADKWGVKSTPVTYRCLQADGTGKEFRTHAHFSIGSKYVIHLHKIPEITAPGPASVNHIGIPTKSTYDNKHFPVSNNPYRYGEDELRVMCMDTPVGEVTRFQNLMANSPLGVTKNIEAILLAKHPTRIKRVPISDGTLMRSSAVLNLFHNTTATLGFETKDTITQPFDLPDELTDSIWETEIVEEKDEEGARRRSNNKQSKMQKMIDAMDDVDEEEFAEEDE